MPSQPFGRSAQLAAALAAFCPCPAQTSTQATDPLPVGVIVFGEPPSHTPARHSVDGPLLGNGDMKVALSGAPERQRFHLGKNDLWRLQRGFGNSSPVPFGELWVDIPALRGASYEVLQPLATPRLEAEFRKGELSVVQRSLVAADRNLLWIRLEAEGGSVDVRVGLEVAEGRGSETSATFEGGVLVGARSFEADTVELPSGVAVAVRSLGAELAASGSPAGGRFTLEPDQPVDLLLTMSSRFESPEFEQRARVAAGELREASLPEVERAHGAWWSRYWQRSWLRIGDPDLELANARSLYGMAACSRDPRFPPGIFGWDTSDQPHWHGDYHLNYNHYAPFYALYAANRIEQADPQDAPVLAFRERGRWYAQEVTGTRGVLFPVGIGPLGVETTFDGPRYRGSPNAEQGGLFFQQRSNAAYALVNIAQRWRCTYDLDYGRRVYPLIRDVAEFWEDYLELDGSRYLIRGDAIHEGSGQDLNPILSLGLIRNALDLALDVSRELGVDADRRDTWRHILEHLSSWTTQERDGRTVFRYTERGTAWWGDNTLGIQAIYPGNCLGLDSAPGWLQVAQDTIAVMGRWQDFNGSNSFFPAAVRVGCDPQQILDQLRAYAAHTWPNGFQRGNPHGIENLSTVPNTLGEMLCSAHVPVGDPDRHESLIRVFPVWPEDRDARFVDIRTWGAHLVSAERTAGEIGWVQIHSERGRPCQLVNPWPSQTIAVHRADGRVERRSGDRVEIDIRAGETIRLTRGMP